MNTQNQQQQKQQQIRLSLQETRLLMEKLHNELSARATISQAIFLFAVAEYGTIEMQKLAEVTGFSAPSISRIAAILGDFKTFSGRDGKSLILIENVDFDRKHKRVTLSRRGKAFIKSLFPNYIEF